MLIKAGVDISRLNREIRRALGKVDAIYAKYASELVITSTYEGTHSAGSLHYANDAFDCRYPKTNKGQCLSEIREVLGSDFDVVGETHHIHIEYDPKR